MKPIVAIIGTGPAALMAAHVLSAENIEVHLFEKRNSAARKLLIAGSSGLNITHALPLPEFIKQYPQSQAWFKTLFDQFSPKDWIRFVEALGVKTFKGTSGRYFVESMTAAKLLAVWRKHLSDNQVCFHFKKECIDFQPSNRLDSTERRWILHFSDGSHFAVDAILMALGGASYEPEEKPFRWPQIFKAKKIALTPFEASNVGHNITWSASFLKEAEGLPLKNILLSTKRGSRKGDLVITRAGIEGTPIYSLGVIGGVSPNLWMDLKPDLSAAQVRQKIIRGTENLSPIRRIKKHLGLCPAALALLYHHSPKGALAEIETAIPLIKHFPLEVSGTQSLDESISSKGGVALRELNSALMLKKYPGVFLAGEMLDWDAPTGGFLIQACVSQGFTAGKGVLRFLGSL